MTGVLAIFKMGICTTRSILAKNFASSFPWIVTMDALEPLVKDQNKNLPTSLFTTKGKHF
jgi:hypothetical protein